MPAALGHNTANRIVIQLRYPTTVDFNSKRHSLVHFIDIHWEKSSFGVVASTIFLLIYIVEMWIRLPNKFWFLNLYCPYYGPQEYANEVKNKDTLKKHCFRTGRINKTSSNAFKTHV